MTPAIDEQCVLIGAGGHAAVLLEALQAAGQPLPKCALDGNPQLHGTRIGGVPIVGADALLADLARDGYRRFVLGVGTGVDTAIRRRLAAAASALGLEPIAVRHPSALTSPSAVVGRGLQLLARAFINTAAQIGDNVLINTAVVVEHHCRVEDDVHLATGAILCGGAIVCRGALVGAGAIVKQGIEIGRHAVVGAGAVVLENVPDGIVVAGVPARPIRG